MERLIKIGLSILLMGCLLKMPYGYFQLVRFLSLLGFAILSYKAHQKNKQSEMFIYGALALLFQPLIKISLGRELWNIVDMIVASGLIVSLIKNKKDAKPYPD